MKLAHHDPPPPDALGDDIPTALDELQATDRFRFASHLRAFIEVDRDGRLTDHGYLDGGRIGATTIGHGTTSITIPAVKLDDIKHPPVVLSDGGVAFVQTVGGRTGAPMPRPVKRPPFVQYHAPIVWTTLQLVIRPDGTHTADLIGASDFPRHWVYDDSGELVAKSSLADYTTWMAESFGRATPWGNEDSPALVTRVETALERELQATIMHGGGRPSVRTLREGDLLFAQGEDDDGELYLLLNGVLVVEVDGEPVAELGPGAVFGERAGLGDGRRTATLRAVTACTFAAAPLDDVAPERLGALAAGHRREAG